MFNQVLNTWCSNLTDIFNACTFLSTFFCTGIGQSKSETLSTRSRSTLINVKSERNLQNIIWYMLIQIMSICSVMTLHDICKFSDVITILITQDGHATKIQHKHSRIFFYIPGQILIYCFYLVLFRMPSDRSWWRSPKNAPICTSIGATSLCDFNKTRNMAHERAHGHII